MKAPYKLIAAAALLALAAAFAFKIHSQTGDKAINKQQIKQILELADIKNINGFERQTDALRLFVNANSIHKIDEEFDRLEGNRTAIDAAVIAHASRQTTEAPHLECSTRTSLLNRLLVAAGYHTRQVIIQSVNENLRSHTFLEVMNPVTHRWEVQDPDYSIYWRHKKTLERVAFTDVVSDLDAHEPCGPEGCGWDIKGREGHDRNRIREKSDIVTFIDRAGKQRYSLYAPGVDPEMLFEKDGRKATYCALVAKNCRDGFYSAASNQISHP